MSESQNLVQQIQEQTIKSAQDFYGESLAGSTASCRAIAPSWRA